MVTQIFTAEYESLSTHSLPTWFADAKFGLFSHWTVGSVPAYAPTGKDPFTLAREEGEEKAFSHTPYAEWYWNSINIPGSPAAKHHADVWGNCDYAEFVQRYFDASQGWDASRWSSLMAASGAKYCVAVTKHHDGVLFWPSETPNPHRGPAWSSSRDLVGDCAQAARSAGLRFGYCHTCGKGGNAVNIVIIKENMGFKDALNRAVEILAGSGTAIQQGSKRGNNKVSRRSWDL